MLSICDSDSGAEEGGEKADKRTWCSHVPRADRALARTRCTREEGDSKEWPAACPRRGARLYMCVVLGGGGALCRVDAGGVVARLESDGVSQYVLHVVSHLGQCDRGDHTITPCNMSPRTLNPGWKPKP